MGRWVDEPALAPGERVVWTTLANRQQGSYRAIGGRLFLTNIRLIFMPNRIDSATGGLAWSRDLADVRRVAIEPRHFGVPFVTSDVGFRRRLRLEARGGEVDIFLVNRVDAALSRITAATERPSSSSS